MATVDTGAEVSVMGQIRLPVKHRDVVKISTLLLLKLTRLPLLTVMMQLTSIVSSSCVITVTSVMMITCV